MTQSVPEVERGQPDPVKDAAANAAATAQAKRGVTDTANSAPVVATPSPTNPPAVPGITEFSNGLVDRSQTKSADLDGLIAKVNAAHPMPAALTQYDRGFVGKADMENPSYRNMMAMQGVYDDAVKQTTANRAAAMGIIEKVAPADINAQAAIAGHNIQLQGTLANAGVNAQHYANQNVQETEKNRQLGITSLAHAGLYGAQTGLAKAQTENMPNKQEIADSQNKARVEAHVVDAISKLGPDATPEQRINAGIATRAALGQGTYVPGTPAVEAQTKWFGPNISAKPAVPATLATPKTAPDQEYVNRYGSVAKAKEAWDRGER
jgi:hypothetical protein